VRRRLKNLAGKKDLRKNFPVPKFLEEYKYNSAQEIEKTRVPFQRYSQKRMDS